MWKEAIGTQFEATLGQLPGTVEFKQALKFAS
jgi:hypothetical protein